MNKFYVCNIILIASFYSYVFKIYKYYIRNNKKEAAGFIRQSLCYTTAMFFVTSV